MNIDLVYLWVDGSDPVWRAKKAAYEQGGEPIASEAVAEARFVNNDELKYSLRSVERYAPWIRHIYIVTDGQVPAWIDLTNPRVSIIDQAEIMPAEALPSFSSPAIEWSLDKIPGLSEYFLYANDDMFMGRPVTPEDFFNSKGYPIVRLRKRKGNKRSDATIYMKTLFRAQELVRQRCGSVCTHVPHHNIDAYRLSDLRACKAAFTKEVDATIHRHVRHEDDIQRAAILYYALATGRGEMKLMGRYNKAMGMKEKIRTSMKGIYHYDARSINIRETNIQRIINRYNPMLFCLNDNEQATDADRLRTREFLERMFPEKSEFEA